MASYEFPQTWVALQLQPCPLQHREPLFGLIPPSTCSFSPQISLSNILLLPLKHTSHQHVFTHSSHRISIQGSANASYWLVSQVPLGESPYDHTTSSFCTSVELAPYSWWQILLPGGDVVKLPSPMTALKSKCMSSWTGKNIFLDSFI